MHSKFRLILPIIFAQGSHMPVIPQPISHHLPTLTNFGHTDGEAPIVERPDLALLLIVPKVHVAIRARSQEPLVMQGVECAGVDRVQDGAAVLLLLIALEGYDALLNQHLVTCSMLPKLLFVNAVRLARPSIDDTPYMSPLGLIAIDCRADPLPSYEFSRVLGALVFKISKRATLQSAVAARQKGYLQSLAKTLSIASMVMTSRPCDHILTNFEQLVEMSAFLPLMRLSELMGQSCLPRSRNLQLPTSKIFNDPSTMPRQICVLSSFQIHLSAGMPRSSDWCQNKVELGCPAATENSLSLLSQEVVAKTLLKEEPAQAMEEMESWKGGDCSGLMSFLQSSWDC